MKGNRRGKGRKESGDEGRRGGKGRTEREDEWGQTEQRKDREWR
jgi:hypothetical protein